MPAPHDTHTVSDHVTVIGGGLAGSEAAWQLASRGIRVTLMEMRPSAMGPAHHTGFLAELVCSNSFKGQDPDTAAGALKHELERLGSLLLACARASTVPAGAALAVDRARFSEAVTRAVEDHPSITVRRREATAIPTDGPVIIATGPLTSPAFETVLSGLVGDGRLAFFDAAAPIVDTSSVDLTVAFAASRYDKGDGADYLNCPFTQAEYEAFIAALVDARRAIHKPFDSLDLFQACQPIEEIARRGLDAPRFGPMKPVGLIDPAIGQRPWAVAQLRFENAARTAANLVGFQTNLAFGEQERVFRMIPGLERAEFHRFGVMHRNTFVDAPRLLAPDLSLRARPEVYLAGQITGTEGYLEAIATGLIAGVNVGALVSGASPLILPADTFLGALLAYATDPATEDYQPMHVNMGLLPPLDKRLGKRLRHAALAARARASLDDHLASHPDFVPAVPIGAFR